jgi:hypothetical protein
MRSGVEGFTGMSVEGLWIEHSILFAQGYCAARADFWVMYTIFPFTIRVISSP